jgi:hypothetical protein
MAYKLLTYDENIFADELKSANFFICIEQLRLQPSFKFINGYLDKLNCKYLVMETDYVSETYSQEFEYYYSSEFKNISKFTSRIHFFSEIDELKKIDFVNFCMCSKKSVQKSYIGYIVVKPVANSFWGVTMLKQYEKSKKRWFNSTIKDNVFIANFKLSIKTLPFQPQDSTLSECATTSLWSNLYYAHKSFRLPYLSVASLSKLIKDKTPYTDGYEKEPPFFLGLTTPQIQKIITEYGLLPVSYPLLSQKQHEMYFFSSYSKVKNDSISIQNEENINHFKNLIYAYNYAGFPILLGYKILNYSKNKYPSHLVVINGFKINDSITENSFYSEKIESLYAHDDQFGPFSKIDFQDINDLDTGKNITVLKTQFLINSENEETSYQGVPTYLYISTPTKIRLTYLGVDKIQNSFRFIIEEILAIVFEKNDEDFNLKRKIYIEKGASYKKRLIKKYLGSNIRIYNEIVNSSFPEYVWIINFYNENGAVCDLILDSTCTLESYCYLQLIFFQDTWNELRKIKLNDPINNLIIYETLEALKFKDLDTELNHIKKDFINHLITFLKYQFSDNYLTQSINNIYNNHLGLKSLKF